MAVPFGFSVGDVIAGLGVLLDAWNAVKDTHGSTSRYQQHMKWLNQLIDVLEKLRLETGDAVPLLAEDSRTALTEFKDALQKKYESYLGTDGKNQKWPVRTFRQLHWAFVKDAEKDLVKLRGDLHLQFTALGLDLDVSTKNAVQNVQIAADETLAALEVVSRSVDRGFDEVGTRLHSLTLQNQNVLQPQIATLTTDIRGSRQILQAFSSQLTAQKLQLDDVQMSIATSATILTETRTLVEETRDTFAQVNATALSMLQQAQHGDRSPLPPFMLPFMKQVMMEGLKQHQDEQGNRGVINSTYNSGRDVGQSTGYSPSQARVSSTGSDSPTTSDDLVIGTMPNEREVLTKARESCARSGTRKEYSSARQLKIWFGTFYIWTRTDIVDDDEPSYAQLLRTTSTTYYFWPAKWFSTRGAYLISEVACKAFRKPEVKFTWEPYRVIPEDSPIIEACINLDIDRIQSLFNKREASPYDRDEHGSSLFEYCVAALGPLLYWPGEEGLISKVIAIANYLAQHGIDPAYSTISTSVGEILASSFRFVNAGPEDLPTMTAFCFLLLLHSVILDKIEVTTLIRQIIDRSQTDPFKDINLRLH